MGTDWVRLFNKRLCDEIMPLNPTELEAFVQAHLDSLGKYSVFRFGFAEDVPAPERIRQLRDQNLEHDFFKVNLVLDLCVFGEKLHLDYWACRAEGFVIDPPGAISDLTLFPHMNPHERIFMLLGRIIWT